MRRWPAFLTGFTLLLGNFCMVPLTVAGAPDPVHHERTAVRSVHAMMSAETYQCPATEDAGSPTSSHHASACGKEDCLLKHVQREGGVIGPSLAVLPCYSRSFVQDEREGGASPMVTASPGPPLSTTRFMVLRC